MGKRRAGGRVICCCGAMASNRAEMEMHLFPELVGIQMLLMSALDALLRGEEMTREQLAALYRRVQINKAAQAQELLARRSLNKKKSDGDRSKIKA